VSTETGEVQPAKITISTGSTSHDIEGPSGQIVANNTDGTLTYSLRDLQGSIVAIAPASGTPRAATEYDPFGTVTTPTPNVIDWTFGDPGYGWLGTHQRTTDFGQTGIGAAGPIEMGARVYLPKVGRFLQTDPIDTDSPNAYDYVGQDSVNDIDLNGMKSCAQYWRDYARDHSSPIPLNCNAGHPGPVSVKAFVNTLRFVYHVGSCAVRLVKSRGVDASACNQF
jgi:RHS repeat-associated protein